jgi:hypothetical protein
MNALFVLAVVAWCCIAIGRADPFIVDPICLNGQCFPVSKMTNKKSLCLFSTHFLFKPDLSADSHDAIVLAGKNSLLQIDSAVSCPRCSLQLVDFLSVVVAANITAPRSIEIRAIGNILVRAAIRAQTVIVECASMQIIAGGSISANGIQPQLPSSTGANTQFGPDEQLYGAGGGHSAGLGIQPMQLGPDSPVAGSPVADDYQQPTQPGLPGGTATPHANVVSMGAAAGPARGGDPGGTVRITVSGILALTNASIDADGLSPQVSDSLACASAGSHVVGCPNGGYLSPPVALVGGGGGGGGSVWIDAGAILGYANVTANGGSVDSIPVVVNWTAMRVASPGGAGGGGRVAVHSKTLSSGVVLRAYGGRSRANGALGTAGLVFTRNKSLLAANHLCILKKDRNSTATVLASRVSHIWQLRILCAIGHK